MAEIFLLPDSRKVPEYDFKDRKAYKAKEESFYAQISNWCKENTNEEDKTYIGKVVKIPHADGYALYMVLNLSPVELIHLPLADAWDSPMADLLTEQRIKEMIQADEEMEKLFPSRA